MKAGKSSNQALLRTLANKESHNFATRRLLVDLKEFKNNKIPTVGVSAHPMDDDFFVWHANLRGPEGTPYEGGVFHLELKIPETYPHNPPQVELLVDLPHPNVFGRKICLDMLDNNREAGKGWSSGYSIMSVLIQLQSFLFEKFYDDGKKESHIKKAIEAANQFKCTRKFCKHGGKLAAWPPFDSRETSTDAFKIIESENELFRKELVCFHTKLDYKENPLGIGLEISRVARTGFIKQASPCLDYISLKAFIKEGIRQSSSNEHFSYWLPLFFGYQDQKEKEKILHLGKKSISMICTGHTKRYKDNMILDLFPSVLSTLGVQIMNEKRHPSIRIFRILFHVHYLYLTFLEENPHLYKELTRIVKEFVAEEEKRNKDAVPSLGAFLTHFLVNWGDIDSSLDTILDEQLDRQVLWLVKQVPELEDEGSESFLDENRALICFKSQQSSYQLVLFWVMLNKFFRKNFKSVQQLLEYYKENLGRLTNKFEDEIQKNSFEILKVSNYEEMYQYLNKGKISQDELNKRLKQAIKNSKRRKYHGKEEEIWALPSKEDQIKTVKKKLPSLNDYIDAEKKTLKSVSEEEWRKLAIARWTWIKEIYDNNTKISAADIATTSDINFREVNTKKAEKLAQLKENYLQTSGLESTKESKYQSNLTWKDLFIKLDIEEHLLLMDSAPDFKNFYTKLQAAFEHITSLIIPIIKVDNLKSGYYYLTALLTHLTNLKHLEIVGSVQNTQLTFAFLKCLSKGFNNFRSKGGRLIEIVYDKFNTYQPGGVDISEQLYGPLKNEVEIKHITLKNNNMLLFKGAKALSDIITSHKNLKEINLVNANLNDTLAKEIADGLMRAKQIEVLNLSKNVGVTATGLNAIIYNLAFSPKLLNLDISGIPINSNTTNLVESLYKLLRISGSLEILNLRNCGTLNNYLTEAFFISLGETRTLKKLDLAYAGQLNDTSCIWLGRAVAFNARKNGSLEYLNLEGGVISNYQRLTKFHSGMEVSDAEHETWYGDANKVSKMSGQEFAKTFYNNLKVLQLSNSTLSSYFDYTAWKKQYNAQDPPLVKLISRSPQLVNLQLQSCGLTKQDADLLLLALDQTRPEARNKLKILNLSRNTFGKEGTKTLASGLKDNKTLEVLDISHNGLGVSGAKAIAQALTHNTSLKYLNLFANKIDVDGARAFEDTLKHNTSLEYIDFGHNRLRNEGLNALARGISSNKNLKVKYLGLRFNFIDADGITRFLKKIYSDGAKSSLEQLFIKNNPIDGFGLDDIHKIHQKLNIQLNIDFFDKFKFVDNEVLERSIWIHPALGTEEDVRTLFEVSHYCGIVLNVRKRTGHSWPNRTVQSNTFYFVEFADPTSVTKALYVASRKEAQLAGTNVRIFKAGSGTYNYTKSKKKQIGKTRTNVFAAREGRPFGRGRGGRGGRRGGAPRGGRRR